MVIKLVVVVVVVSSVPLALMDWDWVVVAIKEEDKSQTEFSCDREKMFSASTLILNNYKSVCIIHMIISTAKCFAGYHVSKTLSAVTRVFSNKQTMSRF